MAIVRQSMHPWRFAVLAIAGSMLATAGVLAHEMTGNGAAGFGSGVARRFSATVSPELTAFDSGRFMTALLRIKHTVSRTRSLPCAGRSSERSAAPVQQFVQGRSPLFNADGVASAAPLNQGWTLRPGKRTRLRFDAEDWDDRIDGDDDAHVPVPAWFRDMLRCLHQLVPQPPHLELATPESLPTTSPFLQPLRC
jgi:hypothetical protein